MITFLNKEFTEYIRNGKFYVCAIIFAIMGVLSPAVAKLTPQLYEMMADELKEAGIVATNVKVTAFDSYTQFFKNAPMALAAFVLLYAGILTVEYQKGTLVMMITKGLSRKKILAAKSVLLILTWTVLYFGFFAITQGYTVYFWDISIVHNLAQAILYFYIFGLYIVSLMILSSVISSGMSGVLIGVAGPVLVFTMLGIVPKISKYFPTKLMDGMGLIKGDVKLSEYNFALIITLVLIVIHFLLATILFRKKAL